MTQINVHEAKTHFSRYLRRAMKGERIVVCLRNRPVAELRALPGEAPKRRRIGIYKGSFTVPKSFFEPLPEEVQRAFEGLGD